MKLYIIKSLLNLCYVVVLIGSVPADIYSSCNKEERLQISLLQGRSFAVTFNLSEEEYTDILTFGEDNSFSMKEMGKLGSNTGSYIDLLGILFFADFSGSFTGNPFSFSFYGIHLGPNISGIDFINFFRSPYCGIFSGTEINN